MSSYRNDASSAFAVMIAFGLIVFLLVILFGAAFGLGFKAV